MALTLAANINAATETITVSGTVPGIAIKGFRFAIDNEAMEFRRFAGADEPYPLPTVNTTWIVYRAVNGTSAASHTAGATLYAVRDALTKGADVATVPSPFPSGGTELSTDIVDALEGAASPDAGNVFATMAAVSSRWVDLGLIDIPAVLATGLRPTLVALVEGELIAQIRFSQAGYVETINEGIFDIGFLTPGLASGSTGLAGLISSVWHDTIGLQIAQFAMGPDGSPTVSTSMAMQAGPLTFGFLSGVAAEGEWAAETEFVGTIVANGQLWLAGPTGESGVAEPDWEAGLFDPITDGEITWTHQGAVPAVGAIHAYAEIVSL